MVKNIICYKLVKKNKKLVLPVEVLAHHTHSIPPKNIACDEEDFNDHDYGNDDFVGYNDIDCGDFEDDLNDVVGVHDYLC